MCRYPLGAISRHFSGPQIHAYIYVPFSRDNKPTEKWCSHLFHFHIYEYMDAIQRLLVAYRTEIHGFVYVSILTRCERCKYNSNRWMNMEEEKKI